MNYEALNALLKQADDCNLAGNFNEAELLANKVIAELEKVGSPIKNPTVSDAKILHCSALITLSCSQWSRGEFQSALTLALISIDHAETLALPDLNARALGNCGIVYANLSDFTQALMYMRKALSIDEELGSKVGIASNLFRIGNVYRNLSDFTQALMYMQKSLTIYEELDNKNGIALNLGTIGGIYLFLGDNANALEYMQKALAMNEEIGNKVSIASNLTGIGTLYSKLSDYSQAHTYFQKALAISEEINWLVSIATILGNIGNVYKDLSDYSQALTYYQKALALNEKMGNKVGIASDLGNCGIVYVYLLDYEQALMYMHKALAINEELGNKGGIANNLGNCGNIYSDLENYPQALENYQKALNINQEIGNKDRIAINLGNIGSVFYRMEDYKSAQEYLLKAVHLSEVIGAEFSRLHWLKALGDVYFRQSNLPQDRDKAEMYLKMSIADSTTLGVKQITRDASLSCYRLYKAQERWQEALEMKEVHDNLKDEINVEEVKKQESIREQQKEIELAKVKADAKHQATEQLLHNVLPPSIAIKMLDGTKLIAEKLPIVSVLFADIVGFTKLSLSISPEELVEGLDKIFSEFDAIAEKYGLEKIKTIGDAYMVVAGAPESRADHAEAMANFAVEILETMQEFRTIFSSGDIQLRIGIHSGEVVAGVIGNKKFAYDLWGDAVNTASRMESHGEPGKIHVTEEFLRKLLMVNGEWLMKETDDFSSLTINHLPLTINHLPLTIIPRGEMEIKGKGRMKTYFLEKIP